MRILKENLRLALKHVVDSANGKSRGVWNRDSTYIKGLEEILEAIEKGEKIEISDS